MRTIKFEPNMEVEKEVNIKIYAIWKYSDNTKKNIESVYETEPIGGKLHFLEENQLGQCAHANVHTLLIITPSSPSPSPSC